MSNLRRQTLIQKWSPLNLFGREHRLPNLHFGGPTCSSSFWGYSFIRRWFWPFNHNTNGGEKNTNQLKLPQPLDLSHPIVQFPPVSVPPPPASSNGPHQNSIAPTLSEYNHFPRCCVPRWSNVVVCRKLKTWPKTVGELVVSYVPARSTAALNSQSFNL